LDGGTNDYHAFLIEEGVMKDLGTLGGYYSNASAINNQGDIVGYSKTATGNTHPFLFSNNTMIDLGTGGSTSANADDINDNGVIVGQTWTSGIGGRAFQLIDGEWTSLGTLGGNNSSSFSVNNIGQIVGAAESETSGWEAFLYENGIMNPIVGKGTNSSGYGINEYGEVVGEIVNQYGRSPFWYENGVLHNFVNSGIYGSALDINNQGQIVGSFYTEGDTSNSHAFLFENRKWTDLGTLGAPKSVATGINEYGEIVGYSETSSGDRHAVLWKPLLVLGLGQIIEDFESGDFSLELPWNKERIDWTVQDFIVHNGNYALQSPQVEDGKSAHLYLTLCTEEEMDISFWLKVSSEVDFDFLVFKIDDVEVGRWSGEIDWTEVSFPLNVGKHRFSWVYIKDESKSQGDDAVWIDDIVFPQSTTCEPCDFFVIPNQNGGCAAICL